MTEYQFRSQYQENKEYRESFFSLAQDIFEIDFSQWYEKGCWGDDYRSYAYFAGKQIIANVSIHKMTILIEGKEKKAIQIGTVMTHPDYRKQGLSKKLMHIVMKKYQDQVDFIYLFANESVLDFYPKFGFQEISESQFMIGEEALRKVEILNNHSLHKLEIDKIEDWKLLLDLAENRNIRKNVLEIENALHLLLFYFIVVFSDSLYYIEELKALVLFEENSDQMELYDIISFEEVTLEEVLPYLIKETIKTVSLCCSVDSNCLEVESKRVKAVDDVLFVKGDFSLEGKAFQFPITSHG